MVGQNVHTILLLYLALSEGILTYSNIAMYVGDILHASEHNTYVAMTV